MQATRIRLLLVDDHKLFRKALIKLVSAFPSIRTIYEASNGKEALSMLAEEAIDVVLLDIQMPEMGGIETLKRIRQEGRSTKVIVLTQFDDESLIVYLLKLGANGFLPKAADPEELEKAIISVLTTGQYYGDRVVRAIGQNLSQEPKLSNLDISPREFQVLLLLKDGNTNKDVSRNLGLTLRTIESYRKRLIQKTGCKNTVDLVSLAYRTGIFPR